MIIASWTQFHGLKCESASRRFQPGEGPSRGLLRDCSTSPINRFAALLLTPATAAAGVTLDPNLWRYKDNVRGTHTRHSPSLTCSPATKGINTLPPTLTHNFQPTSYRPETGARNMGRYCNALTVSRMNSLTMFLLLLLPWSDRVLFYSCRVF